MSKWAPHTKTQCLRCNANSWWQNQRL